MSGWTDVSKILEQKQIGHPVFRFAPCPNGPITLGHLKGLLILDELRKIHKGILNLRFDDTNENQDLRPEYYESFITVSKEYGINYENIKRCSDDWNPYIEAVESLLKKKKAYFCNCEKNAIDCICKEKDLDFNVDKSKGYCVKYLSNREKPYVIMRLLKEKWVPMICLQGPVDDYLDNSSVVIRGRDLQSLSFRQQELSLELYNTPYAPVYYWGRISLWNSKTNKKWNVSKSQLKNKIGFPHLSFFKEWGYSPESIKKFLLSYGFTKNDIKLDISKLHYYLIRQKRFDKKSNLQEVFQSPDGFYSWGNNYGFKKKNLVLCYNKCLFYRIKKH